MEIKENFLLNNPCVKKTVFWKSTPPPASIPLHTVVNIKWIFSDNELAQSERRVWKQFKENG